MLECSLQLIEISTQLPLLLFSSQEDNTYSQSRSKPPTFFSQLEIGCIERIQSDHLQAGWQDDDKERKVRSPIWGLFTSTFGWLTSVLLFKQIVKSAFLVGQKYSGILNSPKHWRGSSSFGLIPYQSFQFFGLQIYCDFGQLIWALVKMQQVQFYCMYQILSWYGIMTSE